MKTETIVGLFVLSAIGIFFYLSFSIGSLRVDRDDFNSFKAYFEDTGGIELKNPVKIAGVDVGRVADIKLDKEGKAMVIFLVNKRNKLAKNASAAVRQEGLIGNRYLEIEPGDSSTGLLLPGSALNLPSHAPATIGEVLSKFSDVASSIRDVANSLKSVFSTREGEDNMRDALKGFAKASNRMSEFSGVLERTLQKNEENINSTLSDMKNVFGTLRKDTPQITRDIRGVAGKLKGQVLPSVKSGMDEMGSAFKNVSKKAGGAFDSLEDTAVQARESFKEFEQVADKINTGKGLVGKIINEDETYNDFKKTMRGLKDYTSKMHSLGILVDMHEELGIRNWQGKGYFDLKLRPAQDYFYNIQLCISEDGSYVRRNIFDTRYDNNGNELTAPTQTDLYRYPNRTEEVTQRRFATMFGFQFGKRFDRMVFRVGLFENTFGAALDYYVPLNSKKLHWVTTFEAYDLKGTNRRNDTRPHLKWLNKLYFMKHIYTTFGIDDVVSKKEASPFFGGGIRFGDKDLKYVLPSVPVSSLRN